MKVSSQGEALYLKTPVGLYYTVNIVEVSFPGAQGGGFVKFCDVCMSTGGGRKAVAAQGTNI